MATFLVRKKTRNHILYKEVVGRSYRNLVIHEFLEIFQKIDFHSVFVSNDPEEVWATLMTKIMSAVNKFCPISTFRVSDRKPEFLTELVEGLMRERDLAFKVVRRYPMSSNWAIARHLRNRVSREIKKARRMVILKHLRLVNGDSKKFWNYINKTFFKASDPVITQIKKNDSILVGVPAANAVNEYFCKISKVLSEKFAGSQIYDTIIDTAPKCDHVPQLSVRRVEEAINRIDISKSSGIPGLPSKLLKIVLKAMPEIFTAPLNLCIATATFPQDCKLAQVVCLPKGGDVRSMNNIRPISLLPISGKILESFLNEKLTDHLEKTQPLNGSTVWF